MPPEREVPAIPGTIPPGDDSGARHLFAQVCGRFFR